MTSSSLPEAVHAAPSRRPHRRRAADFGRHHPERERPDRPQHRDDGSPAHRSRPRQPAAGDPASPPPSGAAAPAEQKPGGRQRRSRGAARRRKPGDAAGQEGDQAVRFQRRRRARHRRNRHRQGAGGAGAARAVAFVPRTLRRGQLRRAAADAGILRAVRAREGRIHRRASTQAWPDRSRARRHDLPRRNRRLSLRDPGASSPLPAGEDDRAGRRLPSGRGRRPRHRRHQQGSRPGSEGGAVPRGSVLPPARPSPASPAVARARRRHRAVEPALPRRVPHRLGGKPVARGDGCLAGALLAGKRPRADGSGAARRGDRRAGRSSAGRPRLLPDRAKAPAAAGGFGS